MLQLIEMYSSKQRTGVLDIETGLEAYIIPPCQLVDRLLQTAKKSAMLATHTSTSIPDGIEDSQLLLVVIHRKVISVTSVCDQNAYCACCCLCSLAVYVNLQHLKLTSRCHAAGLEANIAT